MCKAKLFLRFGRWKNWNISLLFVFYPGKFLFHKDASQHLMRFLMFGRAEPHIPEEDAGSPIWYSALPLKLCL